MGAQSHTSFVGAEISLLYSRSSPSDFRERLLLLKPWMRRGRERKKKKETEQGTHNPKGNVTCDLVCSWVGLKLEKTQLVLAHMEKILAEQKAKNQGLEGGRRSSTGTYRYGKTRRTAKKASRSRERARGATN
jgi:hypothetical protein